MTSNYLGSDRLYDEIRQELGDMSDYLESDTLRRQANTVVRLTVVTVGRDDVVVGAEQRDGARAHRLLADIEVTEAADLPERVRFGAPLLETALKEHGAQKLHVECGVGLRVPLGGVGLLLRGGGHEHQR